MKILITGATGQLGSKIVEHVLTNKTDEEVLVSVRNVEKAKGLEARGVEVRHGNFDDATSLDLAFAGVDRIVLVSADADTATRIRQHATAIEAAKRAGVKEIVYTSLVKADHSPLNLAEVHQDTEKRIIESGLSYKILRNNWYLENEADTIKGAKESKTITTTYGEGKVGWLLRDEYAKAAAAAVLGAGSENTIYTLSGEEKTIDEFAWVLGEILGETIKVNHIDDETLNQFLLQAGLDEGTAGFVVEMNRGIRLGGLDAPSDDYQLLTGAKPLSLKESLKVFVD